MLIGQGPNVGGKIKTFEMIQYIDGFNEKLQGEFNDWPDNIQAAILTALERKAQQVQLPLTIVGAVCDVDYGEAADGSQDRLFIRVIASEIVARDMGYEKRLLDEAIQKAGQ